MIALDTNILIRYFLGQDNSETERARRLVEDELTPGAPGFVTAVTICEIVWVIRNRYAFGREAQVAVLRLILGAPQLIVEHDKAIHDALDSNHSDLADVIIHHVGQANGCSHTLTLDKKFAKLVGVELLK